ncbi:MAG: hypothetical protein ACF8XB_14430 [Planctomycetota bacterium JB042]
MTRSLVRSALLVCPLVLASCAWVEPPNYGSIEDVRGELDSSSFQARSMPTYVEWKDRALLYVPNRLLDLLDVFKASVGVGPGFGLELYGTENAWLGYETYRSWRLALDGRASGVYEEGHHQEWHVGTREGEDARAGRAPLWALRDMRPYEAPLKPGVPAVPEVPRNTWDVGLRAHLALIGAEVLVRPAEIVDFVVGLWGDDLSEDDYGLRYFPLHEYAPQAEIVELFVNAVDQMNEADLAATLSDELRKTSLIRRGRSLFRLGGEDAVEPAARSGARTGDFLILGEVDLEPDRYRDEESDRLDFKVRCTGAVLRWGVPARIDYEITFFNRYVRTPEHFSLELEVEDEHWVVTRIKRIDRLSP